MIPLRAGLFRDAGVFRATFITFADPKVVEYWPACDAACRNAEIGAKFNILMDPGVFPTMCFFMKLPAGTESPDSGEDCDDGI